MNKKIMKSIVLLVLIIFGTNIKANSTQDTLIIGLNYVELNSKNDTIKITGEVEMISKGREFFKKEDSNWKNYLVPILLGLFAGLIALYQVKLNNITAAKIKWVEKYREILSNYLMNIDSSAVNLVNLINLKKTDSTEGEKSERYYQYYEKYSICTDLATKYYFQFKLLFYKKSEESENLESLLDEIDSSSADVKCDDDIIKLREKINSFIKLSQQILGKEWKKIEKRNYKTESSRQLRQ